RRPVNALNHDLLRLIQEGLDLCETRADAQAIIIDSNIEGIFSAGADLRELEKLGLEQLKEFLQMGQETFNRIEDSPKPIIAAIKGPAMGGGCELAMACDFRVAGYSAKFGQPEINLGLVPSWGGTKRLPNLVGRTKAVDLLLSGASLSAEAALNIGLVNRVAADEEVFADLL
ncbi:MAG: enoyl-CoA hydratase/isomerase family protein, partial [Planctomycetes bacterium]|nr:enoyl-CoA hydratase/isomerase family protein [Planctomycetota bacterium]